MTAGARGARAKGVVVAFDPREGLGRVRLDDGAALGFHATQLVDGTRRVEVGTPVEVRVVPWHRGRLEAADVTRR